MPAETKAKLKEKILVATTILNGDPFLERLPSTFIGIIMHLPRSPVYSYFLNLLVPVLAYARSLSGYLITWMSCIPRKVALTCMIHAARLCLQLIHRFIPATYLSVAAVCDLLLALRAPPFSRDAIAERNLRGIRSSPNHLRRFVWLSSERWRVALEQTRSN